MRKAGKSGKGKPSKEKERMSAADVGRIAREVDEGRSRRALEADRRRTAKKTFPKRPTAEQMDRYRRNPGRYDIEGHDTKGAHPKKAAKPQSGRRGSGRAEPPGKPGRRAGDKRDGASAPPPEPEFDDWGNYIMTPEEEAMIHMSRDVADEMAYQREMANGDYTQIKTYLDDVRADEDTGSYAYKMNKRAGFKAFRRKMRDDLRIREEEDAMRRGRGLYYIAPSEKKRSRRRKRA